MDVDSEAVINNLKAKDDDGNGEGDGHVANSSAPDEERVSGNASPFVSGTDVIRKDSNNGLEHGAPYETCDKSLSSNTMSPTNTNNSTDAVVVVVSDEGPSLIAGGQPDVGIDREATNTQERGSGNAAPTDGEGDVARKDSTEKNGINTGDETGNTEPGSRSEAKHPHPPNYVNIPSQRSSVTQPPLIPPVDVLISSASSVSNLENNGGVIWPQTFSISCISPHPGSSNPTNNKQIATKIPNPIFSKDLHRRKSNDDDKPKQSKIRNDDEPTPIHLKNGIVRRANLSRDPDTGIAKVSIRRDVSPDITDIVSYGSGQSNESEAEVVSRRESQARISSSKAGRKRRNNCLKEPKQSNPRINIDTGGAVGNIDRKNYHQPTNQDPTPQQTQTRSSHLKKGRNSKPKQNNNNSSLQTLNISVMSGGNKKHTAPSSKASSPSSKVHYSTTPQLTPPAETVHNISPSSSSSRLPTRRAEKKQSSPSNKSRATNRSKRGEPTEPQNRRVTRSSATPILSVCPIPRYDEDAQPKLLETRTDELPTISQTMSCNKKVNRPPMSDIGEGKPTNPSGPEREPAVVVGSAIPSAAERRVTRSTAPRETKSPPVTLTRPPRARKPKRENAGRVRKNLLVPTAANIINFKEMQINFKKNNVPPKRRNKSPPPSRRAQPERKVKGVVQSPIKNIRLSDKVPYNVRSKDNPAKSIVQHRYRQGIKALKSMSTGSSLKEWFEAEPSASNRAVYATYFSHTNSFVPEHVGDRVTRSKTSGPAPMPSKNTRDVDERRLELETGELRNLLVDSKMGANFDFNILLRRLDSILDWVKRKSGGMVSDAIVVEILRFDTDDVIENLLHWAQFSDIRKFTHFIEALIRRDRGFKQVIESQIPAFIERMTEESMLTLGQVYARCLLDEVLSATANVFSRKQEWSQQRLAFIMTILQAMWSQYDGRKYKEVTSQTEFRRILTKLNIINLLNDGILPLQLLFTFDDRRITALIRLACITEAEKKTSILLTELLTSCDRIVELENEELIIPDVIDIPPDCSDKKRFKLEKRSDVNRKRTRIVESKIKLLRKAKETAQRTEKEIQYLWSNLEFQGQGLIQLLWKAIIGTRTLTQPHTSKTKWMTSLMRRLECIRKSETLTELVAVYHSDFIVEALKKKFRQSRRDVSNLEMMELVTQRRLFA